tara:strand:+ start:229 stop:408 length:180 start_codon:yes stop_codon:yes gene_type:complete
MDINLIPFIKQCSLEMGKPHGYVQYLGGWNSPKMMQRYLSVNGRNLKGLAKYGYSRVKF